MRLAETLPVAERARLDVVAADADRARRLVGQLLLQRALRYARGLPDDAAVEIDRTCQSCGEQHGRPVAADGHGPHLSVSHSGLLVAVASCLHAPVGVDVQRIGQATDPEAWVTQEARTKAGLGAQGGSVVALATPLPGYAAALAVAWPGPVRVVGRD